MRDDDKDLQDLDRLFGHVKADYQAMRHDGALTPAPVQRPRTLRYVYFGAASAAAVMMAVIGANLPGLPPAQNPARLTIPDRAMVPLTLRPIGKVKPRSLTAQRTVSLRLPRRPAAKKG